MRQPKGTNAESLYQTFHSRKEERHGESGSESELAISDRVCVSRLIAVPGAGRALHEGRQSQQTRVGHERTLYLGFTRCSIYHGER